MEKKSKKTYSEKEEREYIIPLRKKWKKTQRYKKTNKAIKAIKEFLARHMKIYDRDLNKIKLDIYLNEFVWTRGIKKPPARVKVRATKEGGIVRAELAELPEKIKFKKLRIEKENKKAEESTEKKKTEEKTEAFEKTDEAKDEKETEEKKAAVIETGKETAKETAKRVKHQTKISKEPKRQFRQALQK